MKGFKFVKILLQIKISFPCQTDFVAMTECSIERGRAVHTVHHNAFVYQLDHYTGSYLSRNMHICMRKWLHSYAACTFVMLYVKLNPKFSYPLVIL